MDSELVFFLALLVAAAVFAWTATIAVRNRLWLVLPLAGLGILAALVYIEDGPGEGDYSGLARLVTAGFPLAGWLLGLSMTSAWYIGRQLGERSRAYAGGTRR